MKTRKTQKPKRSARTKADGAALGPDDASYLRLVGLRLRASRLRVHLNPREVALKVTGFGTKVGDDTIVNYENGNSGMKLPIVRRICQAIGVPFVEVVDPESEFDFNTGTSDAWQMRRRVRQRIKTMLSDDVALVEQYCDSLEGSGTAAPTAGRVPEKRKAA